MDSQQEQVFAALYGRRSIRRYQESQPVAHDQLVHLLEAAMAAPSACNIQPWDFVVVSEAAGMSRLREAIGENGDYNAPAAIVVCGWPALIPWDGDQGTADCCAAIQNILTAATAMGLGTVWIGGFDQARLRAELNIPGEAVPIGIVYVGHPAETWAPRTQYLEEAVHWQRYDPSRPHERRPGALMAPKA